CEAVEVRNIDTDYCRAGPRHLLDGGLGDGIHLLVYGIAAKEVQEHADASAFQTVSIQECGVRLRDLWRTKSSDGILWIIARHDVQHTRSVLDSARDGSGLILCCTYRNDATPADEPACRTQPDEALRRSRRPNG